MSFYAFHPHTREFVGVVYGQPDLNTPGEFLQPAFTVVEEPMPAQEGYKQVLQGGDALGTGSVWELVEDRRSEVWYDENGLQVQIDLGPLPVEAVTTTPRPSAAHVWQGGAWTIDPALLPPPVATPWQIRKALNQLGLRQQVEATIAGSGDVELQDAWQYTSLFERNHPLVIGMGPILGKTEQEIDAVFALAVTL